MPRTVRRGETKAGAFDLRHLRRRRAGSLARGRDSKNAQYGHCDFTVHHLYISSDGVGRYTHNLDGGLSGALVCSGTRLAKRHSFNLYPLMNFVAGIDHYFVACLQARGHLNHRTIVAPQLYRLEVHRVPMVDDTATVPLSCTTTASPGTMTGG